MAWPETPIEPVEQYVFKSSQARVGVFDCPGHHPCFAVTESVQNDLFVLATRPVWIRRNTSDFRYVGPGEVVLHPAGATIERQSDSIAHDLSYWFAVRPDVFGEIVSSHKLERQLPTDAVCPTPDLQYQLRLLLSQVRAGAHDALRIEANVISLLDEICSASGSTGAGSRRFLVKRETHKRAQRLADAAKSYIDDHLGDDIDIDAVASEVGVSPFYLCRLFKSCNGITLHEYRIRQRLAFVMQGLAGRARRNLTQLAMDAGFSSHSHLTRTFKNRLGFPPSAMRYGSRQGAGRIS